MISQLPLHITNRDKWLLQYLYLFYLLTANRDVLCMFAPGFLFFPQELLT